MTRFASQLPEISEDPVVKGGACQPAVSSAVRCQFSRVLGVRLWLNNTVLLALGFLIQNGNSMLYSVGIILVG